MRDWWLWMRERQMLFLRMSATLDLQHICVLSKLQTGIAIRKMQHLRKLWDFMSLMSNLEPCYFPLYKDWDFFAGKGYQPVFFELWSFWFINPDLAVDKHKFAENLSSLDRELQRSKDDFIKEHYVKYGNEDFPPAWKLIDLTSFGCLTKLYFNFANGAAKRK